MPTNALMGFIKSVDSFVKNWQPTHLAVILEGGIPEERLALLPEYKAQRPPTPPDLKIQLPALQEYLDASKTSTITVGDEEADDVMASLAVSSKNEADVIIFSGDKDMLQMVDANISVVSPSATTEKIDADSVFNKTGVRPDQIVDWLALTGDSADNIQGVPGVGVKTAAKWLNEFGTFENIVANKTDLKPPRLAEVLSEHIETVLRNRQMVRLRTLSASDLDWHDFELYGAVPDELIQFFQKYELRSIARSYQEQTLF
jgi:DNA polymerase-1